MTLRENRRSLWDRSLKKLASHVVPSERCIKRAKIQIQEIFDSLKAESGYSISHTAIAGSMGKRTTGIDFDIDGILFLNGTEPYFDNVLDEWLDILDKKFDIENARVTKYSIQFKLNGFKFDILPATNFLNSNDSFHPDRKKIQQRKTLERIARHPRRFSYLYSAALTESVVQFIRKQHGFVNEMIRIAKFWYKSLDFSDYVSGAKAFIELIAVRAANLLRSSDAAKNELHLCCFEKILDFIINFDELDIVFEREYHSEEFREVARHTDCPRVLDPANPYNNLAEAFDNNPDMKRDLIRFASTTKARLERTFISKERKDTEIVAHVFEPQPRIYDQSMSCKLIGFHHETKTLSSAIIRNDFLESDDKSLSLIRTLQRYFTYLVCSYGIDESLVEKDIQRKLQNKIDRVTGKDGSWRRADTDADHEDYDVTFIIPLQKRGSFSISFDFDIKSEPDSD